MTANSKIRLFKNQKSRSQYKRSLRLESLEERALLSVTPLSSDEYADLRAQYAEFDLPENMADLNVITLDLAEGDGLTELKNAISTAGTTAKSDLIVVRTSDTANTIQYTAADDELIINIDATQYGTVTIIGLGSGNFTLNANKQCRVMSIDGSTTNLGGLTIQNGNAYVGGGISVDSGALYIVNSVITGNTAAYGGGIDSVSSTTNVINCTIVGNRSNGAGGGISRNDEGSVNITNSIISLNYNNNDLHNVNGNLNTNENNFIGYYPGFVNGPVFDEDYNLTNLAELDLHLRSDSIVIDKGDNSAVENIHTDIDGHARIYGDTVDIGAYEYQGDRNDVPYSTVVTTLDDSFDLYDDEWSLREAIYYAPEYVTITFAEGLEGTIVLSRGELRIENALAINGDGRITIDADQKSRVFLVQSGTAENPVKLENLTIQNGYASNGGGISVDSGALDIVNSVITGNTSRSYGGGIYNDGMLTVTNSTISGNTASSSNGGGIDNDGVLTVTNSTISGNTSSGDGGGIYNYHYGTLTVTNSTILGNTASRYGGGIDNDRGTLTLTNSTISGNTATYGGGIDNYEGTLTVISSTISGNTATFGSGIYNYYSGALTVTNCTIVGNTDPYGVANGICNDSDSQTVTINNSIVIDPIENGSGAISGSNNLSTYAGLSPRVGNFIYDSSKPLFVDAANGDYHLIAGSQAIDKGSNELAVDENGQALVYDLDGRTRIIHGKVDIGAYESVLSAPTLSVVVEGTTVTFSWDADPYASGYDFQYRAEDGDWISELVNETSFSFEGTLHTEYTARVMALGESDDMNSDFSGELKATVQEIVPVIEGKKVTVNWVDDSPAADSVRYRVAGTTKWTTKKLKAGVTTFSFNGKLGTDYEIEVLLDQQEAKVFQTTAVVLDQAKLKADKAAIQDDTFQVSVTNYAAKNLADNATQALVTVNGVQTVFDIENQEGAAALENGGNVAFADGLFTFTGMNSNTQYKVQVAFTDGLSVSTPSSALSVKTLKAPYLAPVLTSATATSDTSVVVEWESAVGKGTDTPAQKYTVQYSLDGVKWTNATTAATGNSFTIQKLKGGNMYQVRVLATKDSAFEASAPSDVLMAETLALPVTALDKTTVQDDTFQVSVTNYPTTNLLKAAAVNVTTDKFGSAEIALQDGAGSANFENGMAVAFENGALTFTNVPSNTQMKVQVSFTLDACTTALSKALTVKTTIAPYLKPTLTSVTAVSSTSVTVAWETVYGKNTTEPAQYYTVQYSLDGEKWTNATTKATGNSFTIQRLKPGTKYLVAVFATKDSKFNASEPSDAQLVTTLE